MCRAQSLEDLGFGLLTLVTDFKSSNLVFLDFLVSISMAQTPGP